MKKLILFFALSTLFFSCTYCKYEYILTAPVRNNNLFYENDTMKLTLNVNKANVSFINFKLENKLNVPFKVIWDDISIAVDGNSQKIAHKSTKLIDKNNIQPNTNIPSSAYVNETIAPSGNIQYKCDRQKSHCEWITTPMLPTKYKQGLLKKGSKILILLSYQIEGKPFYKNIEIEVSNVIPY